MNGTTIARVAKVCALLGFLLPWALVSCSNMPVATMSGLSLAMGDMAIKNPATGAMEHQHSSPNLFLLLAIVAIVGGLALSFRGTPEETPKQTARIQFIAAAAAAALCVLGIVTLSAGRDQAVAKARGENPLGGEMAGLIQVKLQYGFWVTLVALAASAGAAGLIVTDRETLLDTLGSEARRVAGAAVTRDDDERFWDRIPDKNDPSALEEYVHRFPEGKFAALARTRLQRAGAAPAAAAPTPAAAAAPAASPAAPSVCAACGAPYADGDRFCSGCGAPLAA